MSWRRIVKHLIGVKNIKIKSVKLNENSGDSSSSIYIYVDLYKKDKGKCTYCSKKASGYDIATVDRKWRCTDVDGIPIYLVYTIRRVNCPEHGIVVESVPWALPDSRFCKNLEMTVTFLAANMNKAAIAKFIGIDWATVGNIISRVKKTLEPDVNIKYNNLVHIGIDETSYKKGHNYITTVVNLDNSTVIWAHPGHDKKVLSSFFDCLSPDQLASIETVSCDGARWITYCINKYLTPSVRCIDPYHVVTWANGALDEVRKTAYKTAKKTFQEERKKQIKDEGKPKRGRPKKGSTRAVDGSKKILNSRFALWKNPDNLTNNQEEKIALIKVTDKKLYRAYLLKEKLRLIFKLDDIEDVKEELRKWLSWSQRCRIPSFVKLNKAIKENYDSIIATKKHHISNAKVEALNGKIKQIVYRSRGFRNIYNLIDSVLFFCGGFKIALPNR
jgi:transposase